MPKPTVHIVATLTQRFINIHTTVFTLRRVKHKKGEKKKCTHVLKLVHAVTVQACERLDFLDFVLANLKQLRKRNLKCTYIYIYC